MTPYVLFYWYNTCINIIRSNYDSLQIQFMLTLKNLFPICAFGSEVFTEPIMKNGTLGADSPGTINVGYLTRIIW